MRYDVNSQNTKRALADALQELSAKVRPGENITISQIAGHCNVHRNTFYYHFSDIRELLFWTMHNDFYLGIKSVEKEGGASIREFVADYLNKHEKFLNYAFESLGIETFLDCFRNELNPILKDYIDTYCKAENINPSIPFRKFVAEAFAEQIVSIYLLQARHPEKYTKKMIKNALAMVFDYQIPNVVIHEKEIATDNL